MKLIGAAGWTLVAGAMAAQGNWIVGVVGLGLALFLSQSWIREIEKLNP